MPSEPKTPGFWQRRGKSWKVVLTVKGKRHNYTLHVENEDDVKDFCRREYAILTEPDRADAPQAPAGRWVWKEQEEQKPDTRLRISALLDAFEKSHVQKKTEGTRRAYAPDLAAARKYFVEMQGDPAAEDVRPLQVQEFMDWRAATTLRKGKTGKVSNRTVARSRVLLHIAYNWAESLEMVSGNPVAKTKVPKHDPRGPIILSPDQFDQLVGACDHRPMLRLYVLTLGEAGLRCDSEALWLRWDDVDVSRGFLTVESVRKGRRTKSGKKRVVPMSARLRKAMLEHAARYRLAMYKGARSPWIFHHTESQRHYTAGARIKRLDHGFRNATKRAGLPVELNQHDLRHMRCTRWLAEGKPIHLVQKALGHSSVRVTEGYSHLVERDLLQLVEEPSREALRELVNG